MNYALVQVSPLSILAEFETIPNSLQWPNGDITFAISVGEEREGARFVSVEYSQDSPSEFYSITDIKPSLNGSILLYVRTWTPSDLATVQTTLQQRIDSAAEIQRARYITLGSGQVMTYQEKLNEARACIADANPLPATYPLLASTIGYDGENVTAVAKTVLAAYTNFVQAASKIEGIRRSAKINIKKATTVDDAVKIFNTIAWG